MTDHLAVERPRPRPAGRTRPRFAAPATGGLEASLLALQRSAGNMRVARSVALRRERPVAGRPLRPTPLQHCDDVLTRGLRTAAAARGLQRDAVESGPSLPESVATPALGESFTGSATPTGVAAGTTAAAPGPGAQTDAHDPAGNGQPAVSAAKREEALRALHAVQAGLSPSGVVLTADLFERLKQEHEKLAGLTGWPLPPLAAEPSDDGAAWLLPSIADTLDDLAARLEGLGPDSPPPTSAAIQLTIPMLLLLIFLAVILMMWILSRGKAPPLRWPHLDTGEDEEEEEQQQREQRDEPESRQQEQPERRGGPEPRPVDGPDPPAPPRRCDDDCAPGTTPAYWGLDGLGRPTGVSAIIRGFPSPGEDPQVDPPGYHPDAGDHRGHMLAKSLGGGGSAENIVTLHKTANWSMYHELEAEAREWTVTQPQECFTYRVRADYEGDWLVPWRLVVRMTDCRGDPVINDRQVENRLTH